MKTIIVDLGSTIITETCYHILMMTSQCSGGTGWRWTRPRLTRRRRGRRGERKGKKKKRLSKKSFGDWAKE